MNKSIISLLALLFVSPVNLKFYDHFTPNLVEKKVTTHFNITFAPDLSNRVNPNLYKRRLSDVDILNILVANLYPSILRCKRLDNQKDKLLVDFINKGLTSEYDVNAEKLLIDFGRFTKQNERIDYILNRHNVKNTLNLDSGLLVSEFNRIYKVAARKNFGADIWTYFNEGIDDKRVLADEKAIKNNEVSYQNVYRNILVLTTDGYIEAGIYGKGFDLSKNTIEVFRNAFIASGDKDIHHFFRRNNQFRIKPVNNEVLKNLEILVMELYDRSLSNGGATVQPTDMEIIKLYWAEWLTQSGVKKFELHPFANSKIEAEKIILNFLGVPKLPEIK